MSARKAKRQRCKLARRIRIWTRWSEYLEAHGDTAALAKLGRINRTDLLLIEHSPPGNARADHVAKLHGDQGKTLRSLAVHRQEGSDK